MPFDVETTDEFNEWYGFIVDDYDGMVSIADTLYATHL
jgi:hypothetical protein